MKTVQFNMRIPVRAKERLDSFAIRERRKPVDFIRAAIVEHVSSLYPEDGFRFACDMYNVDPVMLTTTGTDATSTGNFINANVQEA